MGKGKSVIANLHYHYQERVQKDAYINSRLRFKKGILSLRNPNLLLCAASKPLLLKKRLLFYLSSYLLYTYLKRQLKTKGVQSLCLHTVQRHRANHLLTEMSSMSFQQYWYDQSTQELSSSSLLLSKIIIELIS